MNITGTWKGFYEYGVGYVLPHFGKRVEMEISFVADDSNNITGRVTETPSKFSVDAVATIKGFIDEDLISFIKTYPFRPEISEDGSNLLKEGTLDIQHTGHLDIENNAMYGDWLIEDYYIDEEGLNVEDYLTGIWFLERA